MSVLVVTGTGTGVGKTVATAALACHARLAGIDVAVCKPVQTGIARTATTTSPMSARLSGVTELRGLGALSRAARPGGGRRARRHGVARPDGTGGVRARRRRPTLTLVEGAGGLLVELGADGVTLRDIALDLAAPVLVVVSAGLGTLNHTALTLEALASQNISCAGLVIGAWPPNPDRPRRGNSGCAGGAGPGAGGIAGGRRLDERRTSSRS